MMDVLLEQALFGYERGHRMVASSVEPDKDSGRVLRSITDMRFGGVSKSHLTVLPLPRMRCHAFVKTWPGGPSLRPGSVWSHVLLMRHEDLDHARDTAAVLDQFIRPPDDMAIDRGLLRQTYGSKIRVAVGRTQPPAHEPPTSNRSLAQLVTAAYRSSEPSEIVVESPEGLHEQILHLMDQQWPNLRRAFTARTRFRGSTSTVAQFLVSVVERPSGQTPRVTAGSQRWVTTLARDLESPNSDLRKWLAVYGPETPRGREDVPALVTVLTAAKAGRIESTADVVSKRFPGPSTMALLKKALYWTEPLPDGRFGSWPGADPKRLEAALRVSPTAIDYLKLDVPDRLAEFAGDSQVVALIPWEALAIEQLSLVTDALAHQVPAQTLVEVALSSGAPTLALLSGRPDCWVQPALWEVRGDLALELITGASTLLQRQALRRLVEAQQASPAIAVAEIDPPLWWSLFDDDEHGPPISNATESAMAGELLNRLGVGRVGAPAHSLTTDAQLLALNGAAKPDEGLRRHASPDLWVDLARRQPAPSPESATSQSDAYRLLVNALAAGEQSGDSDLRGRAWDATYAQLHEVLAAGGPPDGTMHTLDSVLPGGPEWDWCARLRQGLARAAADDSWNAADVTSIAGRVAEYASDVSARLAELRERKNRSLLDDIIRVFRH